jgi:nicotinamidase-related amidase
MKPFKGMNSQNTALVIVDVINSCAHVNFETPEWNIHFSKIREMVPNLINFIDEFRIKVAGPIMFIKTVPWRKEYLAANVNELYEDKRFSYYSKDTTGKAEEFYQIEPKPGDFVFDKNTCDAFSNQDLNEELKKRKIKYLIITGIFTDGCVLATVLGAFSKGFNVIVLKDLCQTTDSPTRQLIQEKLFEFTFPYMFARVVNSKEVLTEK